MTTAHDRVIAKAQDLAHLMTSDLTAVDDIAEGIIAGRTLSIDDVKELARAWAASAPTTTASFDNMSQHRQHLLMKRLRDTLAAAGFIVEEADQ